MASQTEGRSEKPIRSRSRLRRNALFAAVVGVAVIVTATVVVATRSSRPSTPLTAGRLTWRRVASFASVNALISTERGFLAGGYDGQIWTSKDGTTWGRVGSPEMAGMDIFTLTSYRGRIYAAGQNYGSGFAVWSSPDDRSWSPSLLPVDAAVRRASKSSHVGRGPRVSALAAASHRLVAVGYIPNAQRPLIRIPGLTVGLSPRPLAWYSDDGRTWHSAHLPSERPASVGRLDSVIAIPGGFLALEGAHISSANNTTTADFDHHGVLFSPDGRRWRVASFPEIPQGSDIPVGLLLVDGDRILAVGTATEESDTDLPKAKAADVIGSAHPVVWQRALDGQWRRLTASSSAPGEHGPSTSPTLHSVEAGVEAVARIQNRLLAIGYVQHGDWVDSAMWTSADGGARWSDAIPDGRSTSGARTATALAVHDGLAVALGDDSRLWLGRLRP